MTVEPHTRQRPERQMMWPPSWPVVVVIAAGVALTIVVIHVLGGGDPNLGVVVALVALTLATIRMMVALIENVRGRESLASGATARESAEAVSDRAAALSLAITDSVVDGLLVADAHGLLTFTNPAALRLLGYRSADELLGRPVHPTIHHTHPDGSPYPAEDCPALNVRTTGQPIQIEEDTYWRKDGTPLPVAISAAPIPLNDGARAWRSRFMTSAPSRQSVRSCVLRRTTSSGSSASARRSTRTVSCSTASRSST